MKIVFFNHKGGVSKTTSTFHIGWALAERGSRVLLVDADPQCNLTSLVMQDNFVNYYTDPETKEQNIMDGVKSAFEGKPTPITQVNCFRSNRNPNLFLLAGHPNLTELEPTLSFAQTAPTAFSTLQNLPGAFNALISHTAEFYEIDFVLIDLNPGLSAINQNLFSISDAFILPTNPDPFSLMAINTLTKILPRWYKSATDMKQQFQDSTYPFPDVNPKFLGIILQRYNIRNGRPAAPFQNTMDEIFEAIKNVFVAGLNLAGMMYNQQAYVQAGIEDNYCLAEIPDFQSLQQQSQTHGIPVFALSDEEIGAVGIVLDRMKQKRQEFGDIFFSVAERIELVKQNA